MNHKIAAVILAHVLMYAASSSASCNVAVSLTPSASSIVRGGPCVLEISIRNDGQQDCLLDLGPNQLGAYRFDVENMDGGVIAKPAPLQFPGVSDLGRIKIGPAEEYRRSLILNEWCSTDIAPGQYVVRCDLSAVIAGLVATTTVTVVPDVKGELSQIVDELEHQALAATGSIQSAALAVKQLAYLNEDRASAALAHVIKSGKTFKVRSAAMDGLRRMDSVQAVSALESVLSDEAIAKGIREQALDVVTSMGRWSSNDVIRSRCTELEKTHRRSTNNVPPQLPPNAPTSP